MASLARADALVPAAASSASDSSGARTRRYFNIELQRHRRGGGNLARHVREVAAGPAIGLHGRPPIRARCCFAYVFMRAVMRFSLVRCGIRGVSGWVCSRPCGCPCRCLFWCRHGPFVWTSRRPCKFALCLVASAARYGWWRIDVAGASPHGCAAVDGLRAGTLGSARDGGLGAGSVRWPRRQCGDEEVVWVLWGACASTDVVHPPDTGSAAAVVSSTVCPGGPLRCLVVPLDARRCGVARREC